MAWARSSLLFYAAGATCEIAVKIAGNDMQYAFTFTDSKQQPLDGAKSYRLYLPPNIPAKDFWSLAVYDNETRCMLETERFPTLGSDKARLVVNSDNSVDVFFSPKDPAGKESNWVQTLPGRGWNVILRLYGALQPWFDRRWRPGEIQEVHQQDLARSWIS
jgi:hypothetical protein